MIKPKNTDQILVTQTKWENHTEAFASLLCELVQWKSINNFVYRKQKAISITPWCDSIQCELKLAFYTWDLRSGDVQGEVIHMEWWTEWVILATTSLNASAKKDNTKNTSQQNPFIPNKMHGQDSFTANLNCSIRNKSLEKHRLLTLNFA